MQDAARNLKSHLAMIGAETRDAGSDLTVFETNIFVQFDAPNTITERVAQNGVSSFVIFESVELVDALKFVRRPV